MSDTNLVIAVITLGIGIYAITKKNEVNIIRVKEPVKVVMDSKPTLAPTSKPTVASTIIPTDTPVPASTTISPTPLPTTEVPTISPTPLPTTAPATVLPTVHDVYPSPKPRLLVAPEVEFIKNIKPPRIPIYGGRPKETTVRKAFIPKKVDPWYIFGKDSEEMKKEIEKKMDEGRKADYERIALEQRENELLKKLKEEREELQLQERIKRIEEIKKRRIELSKYEL